jgi:hypothetical protein
MDQGTAITFIAIQAKNTHTGIYIGFIPNELDDGQLQAAYAEAGIEPEHIIVIDDWKTTSQNMAVAFVPLLPQSLRAALLEPSTS